MSDGPFERPNKTNIELMRKLAYSRNDGLRRPQPKCVIHECTKDAWMASSMCKGHAVDLYCLDEPEDVVA